MTVYGAISHALAILRAGLMATTPKRHPMRSVSDDLLSASHHIEEFRSMYEQGAISQEEFDRLRRVLAGPGRDTPDPRAKRPPPALKKDGPQDDFLGIWNCIRNSSPAHPVQLADLIGYVSNRHCGHLILRKALAGMLQDWIEARFVAEIQAHTYYDATGQSPSKTFSGIADEAYSEAIELLRKLGHWSAPDD
jgi:hypothetical protein